MRLDFVRLLVADVPRSLAFYRDVIGMTVAFDDGENYAALDVTPEFGLSLFRRDLMAQAIGSEALPSSARAQDPVVLVYGCDDVDVEADRLRRAGVTIEAEATDRPDWGIRTIHFRDPDGHLVEANSPLPTPTR